MNNFIQPGAALEVTIPGARTKGEGVLVGARLFGIAFDTYTSGAAGVIWTQGVFDIAKTTGEAYTAGALLWWNNTTLKVMSGTGANVEVGVAILAATSGATTARVRIGAIPGVNV